MNQVKIYDNFGSLKKVISSKELQKRADMLIANPSQYRKTNKNKNSSAKSSEIRSKWFREVKESEVQILSPNHLKQLVTV